MIDHATQEVFRAQVTFRQSPVIDNGVYISQIKRWVTQHNRFR
jgi:hypothetical protein